MRSSCNNETTILYFIYIVLKKPVLHNRVSSLCTCFYNLYILVSDNNYTIYCYLIEYLGFNKKYILPQKCLITLFCDYYFF